MTTNATALSMDLRNLIATERPEGVKCCGICGKPDAVASKSVKALPHHSTAITRNLPEQWRMLTKALGSGLMDFATKDRFNAQLESIRALLVAAREEHDAHAPAPVAASDKAKTVEALTAALLLLGVTVENNPNVLMLADRLHSEIRALMDIKADVEKSA
jgi:hypothetical protein